MSLDEAQTQALAYLNEFSSQFQKIPGSAIFLRYVKSSYQNDPVRSAVELFLFLFAVRYLLAPKYSVKPNQVVLTDEEIDDLVEDWTPEPLVPRETKLEAEEVEKRPVIVGYVEFGTRAKDLLLMLFFQSTDLLDRSRSSRTAAPSRTSHHTTSTTLSRMKR